ncbi:MULTISPECIES: hypothetical protein [Halobacterium]|uniref:hypothetical protein n=1 Tax=Halobacterium TaxID=2239 RepID=UPI001962D245|nr:MULTISPECIES: hypothetical protein [Halobacterium]MCF2164934.1 hypothetical protein [Halobacterium salinarum]MCF2168972.1 hypothetical protein [Halobacterium salinarum]MCF2237696.1 hypothetical protein [Halobacterium salinarum]MDL0132838.1 hypothetical protein [Halobacterium salinarum]QRY21678.1 hypothetical protein JT689_00475 [Halobacterium sp. GSL-19]
MAQHGTVKVPDGKLVSVSLTANDRITSVRVTGDFFLEPPEARPHLERAIEGHPVGVDAATLRDAIADVDARLIGFEARDLAAATMEAIA